MRVSSMADFLSAAHNASPLARDATHMGRLRGADANASLSSLAIELLNPFVEHAEALQNKK